MSIYRTWQQRLVTSEDTVSGMTYPDPSLQEFVVTEGPPHVWNPDQGTPDLSNYELFVGSSPLKITGGNVRRLKNNSIFIVADKDQHPLTNLGMMSHVRGEKPPESWYTYRK